jgi:hypothetical protein
MSEQPMSERQLISVQELCSIYELDIQVMVEFADAGLFTPEIQQQDEQQEWFLDSEELPELESLIRLFQSFGIPPEGLDVIRHLRRQVRDLREQLQIQNQRLEAAQRHLQQGIEDL